jgi:MoaA/NifB/PqqE/SkfB family radical SAM enzyme
MSHQQYTHCIWCQMERGLRAKSKTAHVLISRSCVNDCVFCATATKRARQQFPSSDEVLSFIRKCADLGVVHLILSGLGEPTLDPNLETYLMCASDLGFTSITLFTNGFGLTEQSARNWKSMGLSAVLLSLHGIEHGHNRSVQRAGAFAEATKALRIYTKEEYSVSVNTCLTRFNLDEIPTLRDFLRPYRVRAHTLAFPEWSGATVSHPESQISYEDVIGRAEALIPVDDGITMFDNVPYCLVRRPIREMRGVEPMQYLDGHGPLELVPHEGKQYPDSCHLAPCPLLACCPGFESPYIEARGWGRLPLHAEAFLRSAIEACPPAVEAEPLHPALDVPQDGPPGIEGVPGTFIPRGMTVSMPAGMPLPSDVRVILRITERSSSIDASLAPIRERLAWVETSTGLLDSHQLTALRGCRVLLRASQDDLGWIAEHAEELHDANTIFLLPPDDGLVRSANFITALRFAVHVEAGCEAVAGDGLAATCHFYLHNPTLQVPIEPFHTLLHTIASGRGYSLWDTERENPNHNLFVADDGSVTLSARWHRFGRAYGRLGQDWFSLRASCLHRELLLFPQTLSQRRSPCMLCAHLVVCRGFLRALDPAAPCEAWKQAFEQLRRGYNDAKRLLTSSASR